MEEIEIAGFVSVNEYNDGEVISISQLNDDSETVQEIAFTRECAIEIMNYLKEMIGVEL